MPSELLTAWQTAGGEAGLSVMFVEPVTDMAATRAALAALYTGIEDRLDTGTTWTIATSGRVLDPTTGALTGEWSEPTSQTGQGATTTGTNVADATQALIRWNTGAVVNGRFLKGRTFIPGLSTSALSDGALSSATQTDFLTSLSTFLAAGAGLGVWHRPTSGAGGSFHLVTAASVWSELAVQRGRRG